MPTPPVIRLLPIIATALVLFCGLPAAASGGTLHSSVAKEFDTSADVEIIQAIARHLDARVVIEHAPFKRRLSLMQSGRLDFVVGLLKRPEREAFIHYIEPPYKRRSDTVFFLRREGSAAIRTYDDLYPLTIGTILGSKYFPRFDEDPRLNKEPVHDSTANFKKLLSGRIDAAVFPESVGIALIERMAIGEQVVLADYRYSAEKHVYIGISRKSWLMNDIAAVEARIVSLIAGGRIRQIIIDHYARRRLPVPAIQ